MGGQQKQGSETRQRAGWGLMALWAALVTTPLALFSAAHMAALPVATESLAGERDAAGWGIVHVLSDACPCSRSVLAYLAARGAQDGVVEEVVLLDSSASSAVELRELGFQAQRVEGESFCAQFGSEGVPFFQVISPEGDAVYSGAYFDGMARSLSGFLDLETLAAAREGRSVEPRAVFGCPTSQRLKRLLDPFHFKATATRN